jgi:hypothetical protein
MIHRILSNLSAQLPDCAPEAENSLCSVAQAADAIRQAQPPRSWEVTFSLDLQLYRTWPATLIISLALQTLLTATT